MTSSQVLTGVAGAAFVAVKVRPSVVLAIAAIFFLAVLNNGLNLVAAQTYVSDYLNDGAPILVLPLPPYCVGVASGLEPAHWASCLMSHQVGGLEFVRSPVARRLPATNTS
ncbi:hypothetical protein GCM10022232_64930 [Streptomyces plumbiresistens]|uniref:Uncharacterized protein n=2 Tax=Streptomyces plumbiresistens TaxID=511811 RepID=A0ABP7SM66_9ACTN